MKFLGFQGNKEFEESGSQRFRWTLNFSFSFFEVNPKVQHLDSILNF